MADETSERALNPIELATEITIAWLGNPNTRVSADEVPTFLKSMHNALGELSGAPAVAPAEDAAPEHVPAVPVRSSVKPDYILSLIDGRKLKSLKRHLSKHGMTPKEYRERYGLKADYPMVAANYAAQRREVAKKIGLGRKGRDAQAAVAPAAPTAKPAPTKRKPGPKKRAPKAQ
jgi:predicted transcriptional regulator